jgi:hypothetical protein
MRKYFRRPLTRTEVGTISAAAAALAFGLAHADTPHMLGSLFGLAPQQAVRISVVSNNLPALNVDTIKAESSCFVQLKIFAADGSIKLQSDYLKIQPGVAASYDLKYDDLVGGSNPKLAATDFTSRTQVRVASYLSSTGLSGTSWSTRSTAGACRNGSSSSWGSRSSTPRAGRPPSWCRPTHCFRPPSSASRWRPRR